MDSLIRLGSRDAAPFHQKRLPIQACSAYCRTREVSKNSQLAPRIKDCGKKGSFWLTSTCTLSRA